MRHFKKTLLILPLVLLLFGCSKKTQRTSKETKTTLTNTTKITTLKTTSQAITTEDEFRDISVVKNIDEAGSVKGDGIFNPNSSTAIQITLNYGYEFVGLYNGKTKLTDELTYEISNITESLILDAIFKPIKYEISVEKDIDEAATITGVGSFDYKSDTTISIELDNEYLFLGLYDNDDNKVSEDLTYDIKNISDDVTLYAKFKQKTYDVIINQSLENAATITGSGSFVKGCNTTITITTNDYYTYKGLYDENNNLLTEELTYEITNITKPITLNALFDGTIFSFKSYSYEEFLGDATTIDDTFECGSKIELEAEPVEGYEVDGWYVNGEFYSDEAKFTYIMPTKDVEIYAKFRIKEFKITIIDNIEGLGEYYIGDNLYDEDVTYEYGLSVWVDIYSVKGYDFDHYTIDGEEYTYSYAELLMEDNITIYVYYELADMFFYLSFDDTLLQSNNSIYIDILPKDYEAGTNYIYGYYTYKTVINISLNVKTNYYLNGLTSDNDESYTYTMDNDVITLTILDDYNDIIIDILGKIVTLRVEAYDDVEGYTTLGGEFHYGETVNIKAYPNKGYKFSKWVDENGNPYAHSYDAHHYVDYYPNDVDVKLDGDATYIAMFEPNDFYQEFYAVTSDEVFRVNIGMRTYLTTYTIEPEDVSGLTFVCWLNSSDKNDILQTERERMFVMTNEDCALYAYYELNDYTITFELDGGTLSNNTQTVTQRKGFSLEEIPTKENYTFYSYNVIHERVEFTYNGEEYNYVSVFLSHYYGIGYDETEYNNNHVFVNGNVINDRYYPLSLGDVVVIEEYVTADVLVKSDGNSKHNYYYGRNIRVKAIWGCSITLKFNNGTSDITGIVEIGKYVSKTFEDPTKTGYIYGGWTLNGESFNLSYDKVMQNTILICKWIPIEYEIKYTGEYNGHFENKVTTAHYGDEITICFVLNDKYTLEYIKESNSGTKYYDSTFTFTMPANDVKFYASTFSYDIYLRVDDSTMGKIVGEDSFKVIVNDEITFHAEPNEGYGFDGWYCGDEKISEYIDCTITFDPTQFSNSTLIIIKARFGRLITDNYERLGNKIYFGYYPQTEINDNALIEELKTLAGALPDVSQKTDINTLKASTNWKLYDNYYFYPGSPWLDVEVVINPDYSTYNKYTYLNAPYMWYIDIDYDLDGKYDYRGVWIYNYRNDEIKEKSGPSDDYSHQDNNGYSYNKYSLTYWFKYEMIEWDILENNDGKVKLIANLAIDSQNFSLSSNSYASSYIRDFLINDFYNTAFSSLEKTIMSTMNVNGNNDYVTLLSNEEVETYYTEAVLRQTTASDYAQSQNAYIYVNPSQYSTTYNDNCYWLTRSAYTTSGNIYYVSYNGSITYGKTNMTYYGIRPVISITL